MCSITLCYKRKKSLKHWNNYSEGQCYIFKHVSLFRQKQSISPAYIRWVMEYHRLPNSLSNRLGYWKGQWGRRGGGRETDNPLTFILPLFVTFISTKQEFCNPKVHTSPLQNTNFVHVWDTIKQKRIPSRTQNLPCCTTSDFYVLDSITVLFYICVGYGFCCL
jgi:hypothetical protein